MKWLRRISFEVYRLCVRFVRSIRMLEGEKQTCPYRMNDWGPWERVPNIDAWQRIGPDRVCSFCGSLHPEDFEKILDRALAKKDVSVDASDSKRKWYVTRPEVRNAGQGGIKFKGAHALPGSWTERVQPKLQQAVKQTWDALMEQVNPR